MIIININEFLKDNSLHDSEIINASYTDSAKKLILIVEQCASGVSLTKYCTNNDNIILKVNIEFSGIEYVSYDIKQLIGYEIYGIKIGQLEDEDIIMLQVLGEYNEYLELYIRGIGINVNLRVLE